MKAVSSFHLLFLFQAILQLMTPEIISYFDHLSKHPSSNVSLHVKRCGLWFFHVSPSSASQALLVMEYMQSAYFPSSEKSARGLEAYGETLFNHFFPVLLQDTFKSRGVCFTRAAEPREILSVDLFFQPALLVRDSQRSFMEVPTMLMLK